ncbi:MAG: hypothetical protein KKF67_00460 [Nanoarchaeota archaeon]|nr:hypothetical protein [Nanoarchaeota archaeon]
MIFELKSKKDRFLEGGYKKAMRELNEFFGISWDKNTPRIILLKNRNEIDKFVGNKTEDWFVGTAEEKNIILLDRKNYEKESCHKYSDEEYIALIKHELCHLFFRILSKEISMPKWLDEGVAIYLAGQLKFKKIPDKFSNFLRFYSKGGKGVYQESGFVVELLVKKFGKQRLLKLIKSLKSVNSEEDFKEQFKKIYGFNLNYQEINKLWEQ